MRVIAHLSVLALLWMGFGHADDGKSSKMTLQVEKTQIAAAEKVLTSIKGVKSVKYDEKEGHLIILYDKPTLGCCSRIHSALREAGIEYKLISNQEYPACKDKHEGEHSEAVTPTKKTSSKGKKCCKGDSKSS
ncbi:MAG: glutathione S-transferase N-terminal domain-containing protein [Bacteroidia bacterium]